MENAYNRVVPMRLFANWETDRTTASAVQRMFTMALSRLIFTSFPDRQSTLVITVKLLGYKRTLRSNDFPVTANNGRLDIDLNISFTIQYPHFLKRKGNVLQILLQRRKRYKNRQIPGYKTLAIGSVNLAEILQNGTLREIALFDPDNDKEDSSTNNSCLGRLLVASCQSQSFEIENEVSVQRLKEKEMESDDDEDSSTDIQFSDNEQDANSNTQNQNSKQRFRMRNTRQRKMAQRKNLKQKFASLLKKFRVPDDICASTQSGTAAPTAQELEELFEELDNLSDSGPEMVMDNLSIVSNPRPGLRPYFASTSSREILPAITDDRGPTDESDEEWSSEIENVGDNLNPSVPPPPKRLTSGRGFNRGGISIDSSTIQPYNNSQGIAQSATVGCISITSSTTTTTIGAADNNSRTNRGSSLNDVKFTRIENTSPRTVSISDQLSAMLRDDEPWTLSDRVCICSLSDLPVISLLDPSIRILDCATFNDCRLLISTIVAKIQKFCNSSSCSPPCTVLIVIGQEKLLSYVLRAYVESLQSKTTDWINFLRFCIIAPPWSAIGKSLSALDRGQIILRELFERPASEFSPAELKTISEKLRSYSEGSVYRMPIGEAMLQLHGKALGDDKDSCQVFVPFLSEVRVGQFEDEPESAVSSPRVQDENQATPPIGSSGHSSPPSSPHSLQRPPDTQDLQVEYWISNSPSSSDTAVMSSTVGTGTVSVVKSNSQSTKCSIRSAFRSFTIFRKPANNLLFLQFVKEKKKDKMLHKLGMKKGQKSDPETQTPSQCINAVARLICSGKHPLIVWIDGNPWNGVRFFQTSAQWQTHVKHFPVCLPTSEISHRY